MSCFFIFFIAFKGALKCHFVVLSWNDIIGIIGYFRYQKIFFRFFNKWLGEQNMYYLLLIIVSIFYVTFLECKHALSCRFCLFPTIVVILNDFIVKLGCLHQILLIILFFIIIYFYSCELFIFEFVDFTPTRVRMTLV